MNAGFLRLRILHRVNYARKIAFKFNVKCPCYCQIFTKIIMHFRAQMRAQVFNCSFRFCQIFNKKYNPLTNVGKTPQYKTYESPFIVILDLWNADGWGDTAKLIASFPRLLIFNALGNRFRVCVHLTVLVRSDPCPSDRRREEPGFDVWHSTASLYNLYPPPATPQVPPTQPQ
jgi:hypothetical protein